MSELQKAEDGGQNLYEFQEQKQLLHETAEKAAIQMVSFHNAQMAREEVVTFGAAPASMRNIPKAPYFWASPIPLFLVGTLVIPAIGVGSLFTVSGLGAKFLITLGLLAGTKTGLFSTIGYQFAKRIRRSIEQPLPKPTCEVPVDNTYWKTVREELAAREYELYTAMEYVSGSFKEDGLLPGLFGKYEWHLYARPEAKIVPMA